MYELWGMIDIKDTFGNIRFSTPINEGCVWKKELMKEDYILLKFSVETPIYFQLGDYVEMEFGKFEIIDLESLKLNSSTGGYDYELRLDAPYWKWKHKKLFYNRKEGGEATWSLTAIPEVHLRVVLDNLKEIGYTWEEVAYKPAIDATVEDSAKHIQYDNTNIIDALAKIAETWNCEWWITDEEIHLGRNEKEMEPLKFELHQEISEMSRSDSKDTYATRIYAFGSERNIPKTYRRKLIDKITVAGEGMLVEDVVGYYFQGKNTYKADYLTPFSKVAFYKDGKEEEDTPMYPLRFVTFGENSFLYSVDIPFGSLYEGLNFRIYNFTEDVPSSYLTSDDEDVVAQGVVQKRLMLPAGTNCVDAYPGEMTKEGAIEEVVVFEDVYPNRVGEVTKVDTHEYTEKTEDENKNVISEKKWNAYRFEDSAVTFSKDYLIKGKDLRILFQSGDLNGMDFAVWFNPCDKDGGETQQPEKKSDGSWNPKAQVFEIVRNEDYGRPLPDETLKPKAKNGDKEGDKYILYGFDTSYVSDVYIPEAEQKLLEKAQEYVERSKIDPSVYTCKMNSVSFYDTYREIEKYPIIGERVNLINPAYFKEGRQSRIIGFERKLDYQYDSPVYTVGESAQYSRIGDLEKRIEDISYNGKTYSGGSSGGTSVYVVGKNDRTTPTDKNVLSSVRTLLEISSSTEVLGETLREESLRQFLRKDIENSAAQHITFKSGATFQSKEKVSILKSVTRAVTEESSDLYAVSAILTEESDNLSHVSTALMEASGDTSGGTGASTLGQLTNVEDSADTAPAGSVIVMGEDLVYHPDETVLPRIARLMEKVFPFSVSSFSGAATCELGLTKDITLAWAYDREVDSQSINGESLDSSLRSRLFPGVKKTTTYRLLAQSGGMSAEKSLTVSFLLKKYYGVSSSASLTDAQILALGSAWAARAQSSTAFDCTGGRYVYYILPTSLTSGIQFWIGGLRNTDWSQETRQLTNTSGHTESYTLFRLNNLQTGVLNIEVK